MNHWMTKLIHMWMLLAISIWGYLSFSNSHSWDNLNLSDIHFYSVILRLHGKQLILPHARLYFKHLKTASCLIYILTLKGTCAFKYIYYDRFIILLSFLTHFFFLGIFSFKMTSWKCVLLVEHNTLGNVSPDEGMKGQHFLC